MEAWSEDDISQICLYILPMFGVQGKVAHLVPRTLLYRLALTGIMTERRVILRDQFLNDATDAYQEVPALPLATKASVFMRLCVATLQREPSLLVERFARCHRNGALRQFTQRLHDTCTASVPRQVWAVHVAQLPAGTSVDEDDVQFLEQMYQAARSAWKRWPVLNTQPWLTVLSELKLHAARCKQDCCMPGDARHDGEDVVHMMAHAMHDMVMLDSEFQLFGSTRVRDQALCKTLFGHTNFQPTDVGTWGLKQFYAVLLALPFTHEDAPAPLFLAPMYPERIVNPDVDIYERGAAFPRVLQNVSERVYPPIQQPRIPECIAALVHMADYLGYYQRFHLSAFLSAAAPPAYNFEQALDWLMELARATPLSVRSTRMIQARKSKAQPGRERERRAYMQRIFLEDRGGDPKMYGCYGLMKGKGLRGKERQDVIICPHHRGRVGDIEELTLTGCATQCGVPTQELAKSRRRHRSSVHLWSHAIVDPGAK